MATERAEPYGAFNFVVEIEDEAHAGFQEVSGLGMAIDIIEYRNGNEPEIRKLTGRHRYPNAVLRRGVIGSLGLFRWIDEVSHRGAAAARNVRITLLDEEAVAVVRWNLTGAWPLKYEGPHLHAGTSDVAIEELVLTYEGIEME